MSNFEKFSFLVHQQYNKMTKEKRLFTVGEDSRELEKVYIQSFPEGSNPIYKTRTEHECNCCFQFLRNIGNVVSLKEDGEVVTVWDIKDVPKPYNEVAEALRKHVLAQPLTGIFAVSEPEYGRKATRQLLEDQRVIQWKHFHGKSGTFQVRSPAEAKGKYSAKVQVFRKGLEELTLEALTTTRELIVSNGLYRGAEQLSAVDSFLAFKSKYVALPQAKKELFVWTFASYPGALIRNTAVGTLLQDLSGGMDIETAVVRWEKVMAPANYKRPTALITQSMVKSALSTIKELGIEPALERRFATLHDVSVKDVLWVDNSVQNILKGGGVRGILEEALAKSAKTPTPPSAPDVGIDEFIKEVLPSATNVEILLKNNQVPNLVSLTGPANPEAPVLFKWGNNYGWSYNGNYGDSVKERVKAAGGRTDNVLCRVSLSWFNYDDLDLHAAGPNREHIYFGNKNGHSGGMLDVDMNAGTGKTRSAVENIVWPSTMKDGKYDIYVNNFFKRETIDVGFEIEVESNLGLFTYSFNRAVESKGNIAVCSIQAKGGKVISITKDPKVSESARSQNVWGVNTETFIKVNTIVNSPNFWTSQEGAKHWIFGLQGCKNPAPARGIYNEFLDNKLLTHRKVFEVLGNKTLCPPTDDQLSGVGFTAARGDVATVKVTQGSSQRIYQVHF